MNKVVRCKFVCNLKIANADGTAQQIALSPVYSGSDENKQFFQSTPGGQLQLFCTNPEASSIFEQGKEYYIDIQVAN